MTFDPLGDRMKDYEGRETKRRFLPLLPVCARLDGRAFHTWTKNLERPFDKRFVNLMRDVTSYLVQETNAVVGYTQSDEISLVFYSPDPKSQIAPGTGTGWLKNTPESDPQVTPSGKVRAVYPPVE